MKINKKEILEVFEEVAAGVAVNAILPEMLNVNYSDGHLITYNGPRMLSTMYDLGDTPFSVSATKFANIIKTMPADFEIEVTESAVEFFARDKKSKITFGITQHTAADNNIFTTHTTLKKYLDTIDFLPLPSDFLDGVKLCMFSTAKNTNLGTLSCLQVEGEFITSSDNLRISSYHIRGKMEPFLLPSIHCQSILDLQPTKYHLNDIDNTLFFSNEEGVLLYVRTIVGAYPNYKSIAFDTKYNAQENLLLPHEIASLVKNVGVVNADMNDTERYITITLNDTTLTVATQQASGWGEQSVELDYTFDIDFQVVISCSAFLEIIKHTNQIKLSKEDTKLVFGSEKYRHVIPLLQKDAK